MGIPLNFLKKTIMKLASFNNDSLNELKNYNHKLEHSKEYAYAHVM